MEDHNGASTDAAVAAPFSELIRDWLNEGDRLDEKAIATAASAPAAVETRARRILLHLRPALDRYRVVVLAAAGLIPFAIFALTHHSGGVPALVVATPPGAVAMSSAGSLLARPERAPTVAPTAAPPVAAPGFPVAGGICERPAAAPTVLAVRSPDPRPVAHRHHHSVKHHAACGPGGRCAVTRSAPPGARVASATSARPGSTPNRGQHRR